MQKVLVEHQALRNEITIKKGTINVSAMRHPYMPIAIVVLVALALVVSVLELAAVCFFPSSIISSRLSCKFIIRQKM
jgi:hypothetical protein